MQMKAQNSSHAISSPLVAFVANTSLTPFKAFSPNRKLNVKDQFD